MTKTYWAMFWYGSTSNPIFYHKHLCSEHRTLKATKKAIRECEQRGGAKHWILRVEKITDA